MESLSENQKGFFDACRFFDRILGVFLCDIFKKNLSLTS